MITEDLIAYIQAQLRKNISKDIVISRLLSAGWYNDDIQEAFRKIAPPPVQVATPKPPITPNVSKVTFIPTPITTPLKNVPVEKNESMDLYREEIVQAEPQPALNKVWVPIKIEPKVLPVIKEDIPAIKQEKLEPIITPIENSTPIKPVFSNSFSEANSKPLENKISPLTSSPSVQNEELMPRLIPKTPVFINKKEESPVVPPPSLSTFKLTSNNNSPILSDLPNSAMRHSYQKVLSSANQVNTELSKKKRHTVLKTLILLFILSAIGGVVFAVKENYIKLPSFNFSFIKKDPKTLLITTPILLDELKGYKIETSATITAPSFADITSGLVSGEAVTSTDTDFLSFSAKGIVNHEVGASPIFDYKAIFNSSLFKNPLATNLKYNDLVSLVTTPDLSELLGVNAPKPSTVLVPKGDFSVLLALIPDTIQSKVNKIDIEKLISVGLPSYINNETSSLFKDFLNDTTVIEKGEDDIRGTLSYHYEIIADRETSKKLLMGFIDIFTTNLSIDEKNILEERLGAVSLKSLEVWIGKEDNKIHQYKFALKTPLSRLIGLEDRGIAGNEVSLDWQTTYYDLDIPNNIIFPQDGISINNFIKDINDMKIKDKLSLFKPVADGFRNAVGNYGKRDNQAGSCSNPNPNSLFSPIGHPKGASNAVGGMASLMNEMLIATGGNIYCYSTPKAWAISAPLMSDPSTSFCVDSNGVNNIINTGLSGVTCS